MNKFEKLSIRILRALSKSGKMSAYSLYKKTKTEFPLFLKVLLNLREEELINDVDNIIFLSRKGRESIHTSKWKMAITGDKSWKKIPKEFIDIKIEAFDFYIPSIKRLDKNYSVKLIKED